MSSRIFQSAPREKSTYTVHPVYSFTDSLEAYYRKAGSERLALQLNCRKPTKELVLRLLVVYGPIKLNNIIKKAKKTLRKYRIDCCIAVEGTFDEYKKKLTDRAHLHILTDDTRPFEELRDIVSYACWNQGLAPDHDYDIICKKIDHRYDPTYYFTKTGWHKYKATLLHQGLLPPSKNGKRRTIQKLHYINWFPRGKKWKLLNEYKAYRKEMKEKSAIVLAEYLAKQRAENPHRNRIVLAKGKPPRRRWRVADILLWDKNRREQEQ